MALLTVCTCLYACYVCTNVYFRNVNFCSVVKNFWFLEFIYCVCKFDKNKDKNLNNQKKYLLVLDTAQKMKFSIKNFFGKCVNVTKSAVS